MYENMTKFLKKHLSANTYHKLGCLYKNIRKRKSIFIDWIYMIKIIEKFNYYRALKNKNKHKQIIVIGDSHSYFFSGNAILKSKPIYHDENGKITYGIGSDKRFCVLGLGSGLAYNVGKYNTTQRIQEKLDFLDRHFFNSQESLICAFGEIDIRVHVFKHVDQEKNIGFDNVIDNILNNYISFLLKLKSNGKRVIVWGPIASQKDEWITNPEFPRAGNELERNMATYYFNTELEKLCKVNDIEYMSIFKYLIDEDGRTKEKYIFDQCHLGQNARIYLEKELKRIQIDTK